MRCAIIKQTTLKNIGPRVINPYRPPNLTFSYLLRIVSQMRNCKNPSSQVCVLKLKMEIIIIKKKKIENRNLYSFVHLLFVSHHRIATEFCNGTCSLLFQKQNFVHSFFGEIRYYSIVYWMAKCVPALKWLLKFYFIWSSKKYLVRNIRSP